MMQLAIPRPSDSHRASPLRIVLKEAPGAWGPCGDYRAIKNATILNRHPRNDLYLLICSLICSVLFFAYGVSSLVLLQDLSRRQLDFRTFYLDRQYIGLHPIRHPAQRHAEASKKGTEIHEATLYV
nr:unnamed protein product [Spirometra erinaceieuropaei]